MVKWDTDFAKEADRIYWRGSKSHGLDEKLEPREAGERTLVTADQMEESEARSRSGMRQSGSWIAINFGDPRSAINFGDPRSRPMMD